MDTNHKKNSSEWVGARVAQSLCERKKDRAKQTFTPSDRVLRPRPNRTTPAGPEVQAVSGVIATVKSGSKKIQSIIQPEEKPNRNRNSKTHISKITDSKMSLSTQQESHHRVDHYLSDQLPPSLDGGLSGKPSETEYCHFIHPTRISNSTTISRKMKLQINFPKSNDKIWTKINEELDLIIPKVFNTASFNKLSTSELSNKFDTWLYDFFLERFGEKNKRESKSSRKPRPHKTLEQFRIRKKQCKAARKALIKAGLEGTIEEQMIRKEWLSLVRQHNRLRVSLKKQQEAKSKLLAEKSFRSDPHKFAATLFANQ